MTYTKEDCIAGIQKAADKLGDDFSRDDYVELGLKPSPATIWRVVGGWNTAKKAAGLEALCDSSVDVNYFKNVDTPEKAYWLGVLYGDGSASTCEGRLRVALSVNERDRELVEGFASAVNSTYAITEVSRENDTMVMTQIYNPDFARNLAAVGFTADKTHGASLPVLNDELWVSFIRGLSDADGHFHAGRRGRWVLTGSPARMRRLVDRLPVPVRVYDLKTGVPGREHSKTVSRQLTVGQQRNLVSLIEWLYPNGAETTPALGRKKESALTAYNYASN